MIHLKTRIFKYLTISKIFGSSFYSKAGISEQFEGHHGPVTGIHYNKVPGPIDFSHLFLTSSFDWTIKLWNNKVCRMTPFFIFYVKSHFSF